MSNQKKLDFSTTSIRTAIMSDKKEIEVKKNAPTGCDVMDLVVGGGERFGYKFGSIINIVGDFSSGKTFLACELIAACYYRYGKSFKWQYDDCESGWSFDTQRLYGFEIMPADVESRTKSSTVEEAYSNVRIFAESLKKNELGIYVLDSLDGLTSEESDSLAEERHTTFKKGLEFKKGSFKMGKPKYLSQEFFPQLADLLEKSNVMLVIISQVRENIDPMSFTKYSRAGGKAMDFYCHTVLWLANINKMKKKGRPIGVTVKAKTTKSKTPRPYREMYFSLMFDYGLDNIGTNVDFLFDFRTEKGELVKDAAASWDGKASTLDNLKQFLIDNGVEDFYRTNIYPTLKKSQVQEWLDNHETLGDLYRTTFVNSMKRDDLIEYIEKNGLQDELQTRVRAKWEELEQSIRTDRPAKYSNQLSKNSE